MKKQTLITLAFLGVATIGFSQTTVTAAKNPSLEQAGSDTTAVNNSDRKIVSMDKNATTTPATDNGNTQNQQPMPAEQITGREKKPK